MIAYKIRYTQCALVGSDYAISFYDIKTILDSREDMMGRFTDGAAFSFLKLVDYLTEKQSKEDFLKKLNKKAQK